MKYADLKKQIMEYMHVEDDGMIRIALASIIATRLNQSDPVWMILIGPSSSGKSQILRPIAMTDPKFIHRVDDMTENTLLSGMKVKKGEKDISLLKRIGKRGIIIISDFTTIFSKSSEARGAILGQLRMVYDGEMVKYSGTSQEPIKWEGSIGILAGSTPSIYSHFEEVADMGERFIYYRMKDYNVEQATRLSLDRKIYGYELDKKLSEIYAEYIKDTVLAVKDKEINLDPDTENRILDIAILASKLRTPISIDTYTKQITKIPTPEMPMRVALQLKGIAKALITMNDGKDTIADEDMQHIEWCAYSLANEEKRACLRELAKRDYGEFTSTQSIADSIGLSTEITRVYLQYLSAIGMVARSGDSGSLLWRINVEKDHKIIKRLEGVENVEIVEERKISDEEIDENSEVMNNMFEQF